MSKQLDQRKWKDTAKVEMDVVRKVAGEEQVVLKKNALVIVEKTLPNGQWIVFDSNPSQEERRRYKLKPDECKLEDYSETKEIHIPVLLADGWDAQDLLRTR